MASPGRMVEVAANRLAPALRFEPLCLVIELTPFQLWPILRAATWPTVFAHLTRAHSAHDPRKQL
jgi:hypothetical protein